MKEGRIFEQGEEVECDLTGLAGRQGLWYARYPGRVFEMVSQTRVTVQLEDFDGVTLACRRVYVKRTDTCQTLPPVGKRVQVRMPDGAVDVWWDAVVTKVQASGDVHVTFDGAWDNEPAQAIVALRDVRPRNKPRE